MKAKISHQFEAYLKPWGLPKFTTTPLNLDVQPMSVYLRGKIQTKSSSKTGQFGCIRANFSDLYPDFYELWIDLCADLSRFMLISMIYV